MQWPVPLVHMLARSFAATFLHHYQALQPLWPLLGMALTYAATFVAAYVNHCSVQLHFGRCGCVHITFL